MIWSLVFFNDTATTEIYTLSLHDALPISSFTMGSGRSDLARKVSSLTCTDTSPSFVRNTKPLTPDRKSTRLNSSHANISYAVFCLKKKTRPPLRSVQTPTSNSPCHTHYTT